MEGDLASLSKGATVFAGSAEAKLVRLMDELAPLVARYDVVVANPPYMGGSNMNKWVAGWVKKFYPLSKRDICTCFIERGGALVKERGYVSMITASSWMFISSFEQFRRELLASGSICSMIQQSTHGYAGVTVPTTMFVFADSQPDIVGSYIRLEDFDRPQWQEEKALEALADPGCGWFYRRNVEAFEAIPGSPIAYWVGESLYVAFKRSSGIQNRFMTIVKGIFTGNNDRFLRQWYEVTASSIGESWQLYAKGGPFRKWYGNIEHVVDWHDAGARLSSYEGSGTGASQYFGKETLTWTKISSSDACFRWNPVNVFFDDASPAFVIAGNADQHELSVLAFLNSSLTRECLTFLAPTLNFQCGDIKKLPYIAEIDDVITKSTVINCIDIEACDWNNKEISHAFLNHPLL